MKNVAQYEAVFLQLADEHRTVNAFELHELLEACLPNGMRMLTSNFVGHNTKLHILIYVYRLHKKLRKSGCVPPTRFGV